MRKYEQYYSEMVSHNKPLFDAFQKAHDLYVANPYLPSEAFHALGKEVTTIIREWERRLCRETERGQYSRYSSNLSEKFWQVVRIRFPKIDFVGVVMKKV